MFTVPESGGKLYVIFLYLLLTAPHEPLAVTDEWKGKSGLLAHADFVMETDAIVGRVLDVLDKPEFPTTRLIYSLATTVKLRLLHW